MKKIIAVVLVALTAGLSVNAQEIPERRKEGMKRHMGPGSMHHRGRGGMDMKQLNLTEAQKEQFKAQRESFRKQMEELKKNDNITVKEWKTKMEDLRKQQKNQAASILTADQKAQLEKMKSDGKARHEDMMKKRGESMKTRLGLSNDQSAKLEQSRKEMGEKMKALRGNQSLSEEKKREQMKELMKEQKENMKSILTEEQLKKMKEARPQGPRHREGMKEGMKKEMI